jgi:hypothetical protein
MMTIRACERGGRDKTVALSRKGGLTKAVQLVLNWNYRRGNHGVYGGESWFVILGLQ